MRAPQPATSPPPRGCDIAVVGAGIVGLATALELKRRHPDASVAVLDREPAIATHQTGHSSGVIHAGIYYRPGSLKARLCREGADALYDYCRERGIPADPCGKIVVAVRPADLPRLDELERRSRENGVPGLRRLDPDGIREVEPAATGLAALHSPETGIVDFAAVATGYARDLEELGGEVRTGCDVRAVVDREDGVEIVLRGGDTNGAGGAAAGEVVRATRAVTCAGAWSDLLAVASGARTDLRIVPFRGAYLRLKPERTHLVRGQIYPVPDPALPFLGVHLSRTIGGDVLLGPTALLAGARDAYRLARVRRADLGATLRWPGTAKLVRRWWRTGIREIAGAASRRLVVNDLARYVPEIGLDDVEPGPSGVRAQAVGRDGSLVDDFAFAATAHALHVLNAPSPAATASLAIARMVADRLDGRSA
jgi:(S)-2-hydroxyglutarate dehydrogenase